ncbi:MAG: hypothetical protein R3263_11525, partial [Myxococcota bacterium]|nr:hypothetical protein [Myxococcota bacterium]
DPVTVGRESRPTTRSVSKWVETLQADPDRLRQAREILARLPDPDLASWGFEPGALRAEVAALAPTGARPSRARLTRYALERRLLVRLRRNIHGNALGRLVRRVRTACDVLLR